jgi:penicillin-binding protein 1C
MKKRLTQLCIALIALLVLAHVVPLPARLLVQPSSVLLYSDGTPMHVFLSPDEKWRYPTTLSDVDPKYLRALLAYEDARFHQHPGVDPLAVARAMLQNIQAGGVVSGASTLTMQLVRITEPRRRTLFAKAIEAARALQMEVRLSKEEILQHYITFAPYGRNIEGVQAASWALFGHSPRTLSWSEIAVLLALPQRPNERAPSPAHRGVLEDARRHVLAVLASGNVVTMDDALERELQQTPVPARFLPVARDAPHAAMWLRAQPASVRMHTTLRASVQRQTERLFHGEAQAQQRQGIDNGAVVVVNHHTGAIEALVGGDDFFGDGDGAQIPAFAVARSVGSTLKPVLYAQAIDDGRLLPETLVADVPRRFGTYSPTNFDDGFDGLVTFESALARSLNLPFVEVLQQTGIDRFLGTLRRAGVDSLRDAQGYYGLSAALGSVEMSPIELASVYVMIAHDGHPLEVTPWPDALVAPRPPLFSTGSMYLTRRALSLRDRPDLPERGRREHELRAIHWKTGTSFSHRDAWAVGSNANHTVVVWRGNLNNKPSVHLVGAQAAGPLLFDVLSSLSNSSDAPVDEQVPSDLQPITVCALSGLPPGDACPHTKQALARAQKVPTDTCNVHQRFEIDVDTDTEVRPGCRGNKRTREEVRTLWPPAVRRFLKKKQLPFDAKPPLHGDCRPVGAPPEIITPEPAEDVIVIPGLDAAKQEVPLEAVGDGELHWYVDGVHVGSVAAHERVWWQPVAGMHTLVVVDGQGNRTEQALRVRHMQP